MRIYLSGPMRNYPQYNFPAFDEAAAFLRGQGHEVLSPADSDRERGFDPNAGSPSPEDLRAMILRDCQDVCTVDMVVLLDGWEQSKGAAVEASLAIFLGIPLVRYSKLKPAIEKANAVREFVSIEGLKEN